MSENKLMRDAFIDEIYKSALIDKDIIFISADFGAAALDDFREKAYKGVKIDVNKFIDTNAIIFEDSIEGRLSWSIMGYTLWYAANLIPEIADDILNIDRAMRWGFAWSKGPFELLDLAGNLEFINKCKEENLPITGMLKVLLDSGEKTFYKNKKKKYLSIDGSYYYVS